MNLLQNSNLLDRLASTYALGTLRGGARRRFETLAREQAPIRAAALIWQTRLTALTELQPAVAPSPVVWTRIENLLQGEADARAMRQARASSAPAGAASKVGGWGDWLRSLALWRGATAAGALATVVAVVVGVNQRDGLQAQLGQQISQASQLGSQVAQLKTRLQTSPQIEYVAVLADNQQAPAMLVTFDANNKTLTLQRVGAFQEASDRSLQLWALPPSGGPQSLGVMSADKVLRLVAADANVRNVPTLAISLEPKGGVPGSGGPTGPVLFKGALIQKQL